MSRSLVLGAFFLSCLDLLRGPPSLAESQVPSHPAEVISFSPDGVVKGVRQVRATFSEAMVPFGDPRPKADPFEIQCSEKGVGRWADSENWVFDFDRDLPGGVVCEFNLKPNLRSLEGHYFQGRRNFTFSTGAPAVIQISPYEGNRIEEDQAFILKVDAKIDEKAMGEGAYFQIEGVEDQIPVKLITGADRRRILKKGTYSFTEAFEKNPKEDFSIFIVQAKRMFPPNAKVTLFWRGGEGEALVPGPISVGGTGQAVQAFHYQVREEFKATFTCEKANPDLKCVPVGGMRLSFSTPVLWSTAKKIRLKSLDAQGEGALKSLDKKEWKPSLKSQGERESENDKDFTVTSVSFDGPFPENSRFQLILPSGLVDESNRKLANANQFPLEVGTEEFPPLAKFAAEFGVIEAASEPALPVTLRNLEPTIQAKIGRVGGENIKGKILKVGGIKMIAEYLAKVGRAGDGDHRGVSILERDTDNQAEETDSELAKNLEIRSLSIPKPNGDKAFEVVGIPLKDPGFYIVELESEKLGSALLGGKKPMFVSTAALVTNLAVHFKKGRESSLIWVTSLNNAKPVEAAQVSVYDCAGNLLAQTKTDALGKGQVFGLPKQTRNCQTKNSYSPYLSEFFVTAETGDDFSFVHSTWNRGIESWRFHVPIEYSYFDSEPVLASTVFDRTLFRAGETVHMKHFLRTHRMEGLSFVPKQDLPKAVQIQHLGSTQKYQIPVTWASNNTAESIWNIPKNAKLGEYEVSFPKSEYNSLRSGEFRVEDFRVPLMKATIKPPKEILISPEKVEVDFAVEYLAGGAAAKLPVQVRYQQYQEASISFPDWEEYTFSNGSIAEMKPSLESTDDENAEQDRNSTGESSPNSHDSKDSKIHRQATQLDQVGTGRVEFSDIQTSEVPSRIQFELEFRDPNGEIQTASSTVPIYPSQVLVGLRADSWFASKNRLKFTAAVVDLKGNPISNAPVQAEFIERKVLSHRKKLVGGFYAYENYIEVKKLGKACEGTTDNHGILICDTVPPIAGNLIIQASTKDSAGNTNSANISTWVYDRDQWWFEQEDHDRMDLIGEKKKFEPGEKATFQVRMPFREATALVTVEREGILDSYVVPISAEKPLVEVPIKKNYAPNVFVSVLAVRGRLGNVQPTALIDLGKPAYKLGIAEINVGWKANELNVRVTPEKDLYRVREKAKVKIQVTPQGNKSLPSGSEAIVAAVDEGLLQLKSNDSWNLLSVMMHRRGYEIETSTMQMQVVGKRHFGRKALPQGGGGGKASTRELFETLLLWKARVPLDENGRATVEVPLNDSITSFRIVAIAHGGKDLFGTGHSTIRTTQDLMILSGIPPLVREGDQVPAEITLRNTTHDTMNLNVEAKLNGKTLKNQTIRLAAGESQMARWPITVPSGVESLVYEFAAKPVGEGGVLDRIKISQKVLPSIPDRIIQATLAQVDGDYHIPVEKPADALPGRGGINVALQPTLLAGLTGVRDYMKAYPYVCLEQRISKAIALSDSTGQKLWEKVIEELPAYMDRDGLLKYFPGSLQGSDTLTSYFLAIAHEAGREIPENYRSQIVSGLEKFATGSITRWSALPTADLTVRKLAAFEALSRTGGVKAEMLTSLELKPLLWPTSAVIDWLNILHRVDGIPEKEERMKEAEQILRSRMTFQGTSLVFSTEEMDRLWWLMISGDVNANRLILSILDLPNWPNRNGDLGRIVRGALYRQRHGHWATTTSNAWGAIAIEKFAREFERDQIVGESKVTLTGTGEPSSQSSGNTIEKKTLGVDWSESPNGKDLHFAWLEKPNQPRGELLVTAPKKGKPWVTVQSVAAIPLLQPISSGFKISKTLNAVERKDAGSWTKGDIVRVHLELESQADMTWVVVNDPIPAGASILGAVLGNDSGLSTKGEKREGWVWPIFEERTFDSFKSYFELVPKGKWTVEYTIRLNESGILNLPPTHVEAMYAPEMFGELPNPPMKVVE